jgi:hypothetical protein
LIVGGRMPSSIVLIENVASMAPAAVSVWPIIDLFELTGTRFMRSPNTASSDIASILSFSGVPVPWALT